MQQLISTVVGPWMTEVMRLEAHELENQIEEQEAQLLVLKVRRTQLYRQAQIRRARGYRPVDER